LIQSTVFIVKDIQIKKKIKTKNICQIQNPE